MAARPTSRSDDAIPDQRLDVRLEGLHPVHRLTAVHQLLSEGLPSGRLMVSRTEPVETKTSAASAIP